jgi:hypothetical protein
MKSRYKSKKRRYAVWLPAHGLDTDGLFSVLESYGIGNDTISLDEYDDNTIKATIVVTIKIDS